MGDTQSRMGVGVIGGGYVGLTTGTVLASFGFPVVIVENDHEKLENLKGGACPIYEPGLDELIKQAMASGCLYFTGRIEDALASSEIVFVAVGTPSRVDGSADLSAVEGVVDIIAGSLWRSLVVVVKSTVPIGTCDQLEGRIHAILRKRENELRSAGALVPSDDVTSLCSVVSNPEFLREGKALVDLVHPQRIVVGTSSRPALEALRKLYEGIDAPMLVTSRKSAEAIKYASNAFLAAKISFINEVANLCECLGADVLEVAEGMGLDDRIGMRFLQAGIGYGGSCFPKDTKALLRIAKDVNCRFDILDAVIRVNEQQKLRVTGILKEMLGDLKGKRISLLGLSFKPGTDDVREAPSIVVSRGLLAEGAKVVGYDPQASRAFQSEVNGVVLVESAPEAAKEADAIVLLTEWPEFQELDLRTIRAAMNGDVLVDGRNALDPDAACRAGFRYHGIGRPFVLDQHHDLGKTGVFA